MAIGHTPLLTTLPPYLTTLPPPLYLIPHCPHLLPHCNHLLPPRSSVCLSFIACHMSTSDIPPIHHIWPNPSFHLIFSLKTMQLDTGESKRYSTFMPFSVFVVCLWFHILLYRDYRTRVMERVMSHFTLHAIIFCVLYT